MDSVQAIFEALGGPANVGRAIGKPTEHATAMKRRGSIPVRYWPALIGYAAEHKIDGVDYPALVAAHAAPPAASTPVIATPQPEALAS